MVVVEDITFTGEIHPAAEAWPLLPEDELAELAASIAEIGLQDPITLDPAGRLLDGRNRLNACRDAGVEAEFVIYDGDPVPFILAKNGDRRHMTTGAKAMTTAVVLAEAGYRKNGRWQRGAVTDNGESSHNEGWRRALRDAGMVIDHTPDLAEQVIAGDLALDAAYKRSREAKARAESEESRLADLREAAPDLAEKVEAKELKLGEAEAAKKQRDEEAEKRFRAAIKSTREAATAWAWLRRMAWAWLRRMADADIERQDDVVAALNERDADLIADAIACIKKGTK